MAQAVALGIYFREWNAGPQIDTKMQDPGFDVDIALDPATGLPLPLAQPSCVV